MIYIFHGDNFVVSRQSLNQALSIKPKRFDGLNLSSESLTQALESNPLFQENQPILIENLLTLPRSKLKESLIKLVLSNQDKQIYLWEKKILTPAVKKQFSKAQVQEFKLPPSLFNFLDSLKVADFRLSLIHSPAELVFYLFHRRVSQLIQVQTDPQSVKAVSWQLGKLKSQAKSVSLTKLLELHKQLLEIDEQIKTGQTDVPLSTQLDLLLTTL
ncbi:MAG: hypothetical protein V1810_04885 [Candidatus Beckwithbacteria bacterium]